MELKCQCQKYHLLEDDQALYSETVAQRRRHSILTFTLALISSVSLLINLWLALGRSTCANTESLFANLRYDTPTPIYASTQFGPAIGTEEERDRHWNALDISPGVIAIPDKVADEYGLPHSQRFPWDQSVGVYFLGAYHQIHCLKDTYQYISALKNGRTTQISHEHVLHCLDDGLQDAYCHADDLPWMQLPPQPYRKNYPEYQTRQCKSWDKLLSWASQYNACYRYQNVTDADGNTVTTFQEKYRFCPEGSPYIPAMEAYFREKEVSSK